MTAKSKSDPVALSGRTPPHDIQWSSAPRMIASGACMGTADLVPGVSGGTMAVALGIYRQLLGAITSVGVPAARALVRGQFSQVLALVHYRFIACLGFGIALALVVMGKVVRLHEMVSTSPKPVYAVFFGLVLASALLLIRTVTNWKALQAVALVIGGVAGWLVVTLVPTHTPETPIVVFLSGAIAICAMILPGISGSFILLILGKYEYVISSILELNLAVAVPFALGCGLGLAAFSRVLGKALDLWHDTVLASLTGLLLGSLWRIWPYQHLEKAMIRGKERVIEADAFWPQSFEPSVAGLIVLGIALVLGVEWLARRRTTGAPVPTISASASTGE